jgi:hypothetical protein
MELRSLTPAGISKFDEYLDELTSTPTEKPPSSLLMDNAYSEKVPGNLSIDESEQFGSKMEAAKYLFEILSNIGASYNVGTSSGLWTWLALCYFDQLCPDRHGSRNVGEKVRYILPGTSSEDHWRRYYRHLLAGPYDIYRNHKENARIFLHGPLSVMGDFTEQLASRMDIMANKGVIEAADLLFYDRARKEPKKGATNRNKAGNIRRFVTLVTQFDLTYDLYAMRGREIVKLLPSEFDSWRR